MTSTMRAATLVGILLASAGCGYRGAESLPLPGGPGTKDTYPITVELNDAGNLVPKETCRANDTVIGSVASVELTKDLRAEVICRVSKGVALPANVRATLRQTSLLGEHYLALDPPAGVAPTGSLRPGSTITVGSTAADPDVETVLAALSQVLNGGSLGSVETIMRELNIALQRADVGETITLLGSTLDEIADNKATLTQALDSLDRFSARLAAERDAVDDALDSVPAGIAVLERQRPHLVQALEEVDALSRVARPLIQQSREATVADLEALQPILAGLDEANTDLARSLRRIAMFPFPSNASYGVKGDYAGFNGTLLLDLDFINSLLGAIISSTPAGEVSEAPEPPKAPSDAAAGAERPEPTPLLEDTLRRLVPQTPPSGGAPGPTDVSGLLGSLLGGDRR